MPAWKRRFLHRPRWSSAGSFIVREMSAISSTSPMASTGTAAASPAEIDASCRLPLVGMFASAALWLVVASVLGMIATLKFHSPNLLADCPCFTYGRVHPASLNALIYGFGLQAG